MFKGIQGTTLIDFPKRIASILFTEGCNFECPYCYNNQLVIPQIYQKLPEIPEEEIFSFLEKRQKFIDGVVITGGEPLLHHPSLKMFLQKLKEKFSNFDVKLDTNGTFPQEMEELIKENLIDYVAIDLKTSWEKYDFFTSTPQIKEKLEKSADILRNNKIEYEFRTTVIKPFFTPEDAKVIADFLNEGEKYYLQQLKIMPELMLNWEKLEKYQDDLTYRRDEIEDLIQIFQKNNISIGLRGF